VGKGNGAPLSGIFVYLIWLIEAGIIGYFALTAPVAAAKEPYSEKLSAWADEAQVVMTLPITDPEMVSKIESASSVDDLLDIPIPQTDQSTQFAVYTVNSIPGEELEDAYLSVDSVSYTVNKKGEQETITKSLVAHAVLSAEKRQQLIENAELLQEAMAEYRASLLEDEADAESHEDDLENE
jgi:siroheme synthase